MQQQQKTTRINARKTRISGNNIDIAGSTNDYFTYNTFVDGSIKGVIGSN